MNGQQIIIIYHRGSRINVILEFHALSKAVAKIQIEFLEHF